MVLAATRPTQRGKSRIYQFRKVVPERLRGLIGKREVKVSLGTCDAHEARRIHAEIAAQVEAEWAERERAAARGEAQPTRLTQEEVVGLAGRIYRDLMDRHGADPGDRASWLERIERAQPALRPDARTSAPRMVWAGWTGSVGACAARLVGSRVEELLDALALHIDFDSRNRLNLAGAAACVQAYRELAKRAGGDFSPDPDAARFPTEAVGVLRTPGAPVSWRAVHEEYKKESKPAAATIKRQTGVLVAFFAFLGHEDMSRVTKADAERWIAHRLEKVSPRTVRDADMAHPKTLFIWAKRKGWVQHRPFEDIKVKVPETEQLRDREFDMDEAERILAATLVPCGPRMSVEHAAARRWVPWIACYTGARVNEITQARAEDVAERKSRSGAMVWCIRLTPEAGSVKNGKARWVALHPHLIEQGFLDYVATREGKHLFYDPTRGKGADAANPQYKKVGEKLAAWVRSDAVGVTDVGVDPNHGWRHLFRSSLLAGGVQEQVIDRIDGHASATVGQSYGTAWPELMLTAVSTIPPYRLGGRI
jgi:integrase